MSNLIDIITREMKLRNYSQKTILAYISVIKDLYKFYNKPLKNLQTEDLKQYLYSKQKQKLSSQTIALYANAINYLYVQIYKLPNYQKLKHPKRSQKLPVVLNRDEIIMILEALKNTKHKLLLALTYGSGLKVSEVVRLKVRDVDLSELTIMVRLGKGKKDRRTLLPATVLLELNKLII